MTATYEQLKGCLAIDRASLDDELINQAQIHFNIGEALVEAIDRRDYLKEQLGILEAELDSIIRKNHEDLTNAGVAAMIRKHPKRRAAHEEYSKAKKKADKLQVLKESFVQRASMLKRLCDLYTSEYWDQSSFRSTANKNTVVYRHRREKLARAREQAE